MLVFLLRNRKIEKNILGFFIAFVLLCVSISAVSGSSRFEFSNSTMFYKPIKKAKFLKNKKEMMQDEICVYAESLDSECASLAHPPCKKLVPIAFNFCTSDFYRMMHPQVTSKSEDIYWFRKYKHCVKSATKALVTNEDRQNKYCKDEESELELQEDFNVEDDFFN